MRRAAKYGATCGAVGLAIATAVTLTGSTVTTTVRPIPYITLTPGAVAPSCGVMVVWLDSAGTVDSEQDTGFC